MERQPPRDGGDFSDKHYKTNKGKGRAQTPPRAPSPEPELFDRRTGASSSTYRPPLESSSASSSGRSSNRPLSSASSSGRSSNRPLSSASMSALSSDHYMSVLPFLPMRWLLMISCVSKSFFALRMHPLWFLVAYKCFRLSFPHSDRWDDDCDLPETMGFFMLRDLYITYFTDMRSEARLFSDFGADILNVWISQTSEMPPDREHNLPFFLDAPRLAGFFSSFYSRQRFKAVVRGALIDNWSMFFRMVARNNCSALDVVLIGKFALQQIIRCEYLLRIADMFCISRCAIHSWEWTRTLMHNPVLTRDASTLVMDVPESGVSGLNALFEEVLLNPTLGNLHLIFSCLKRGDTGLARVLLHYVRCYSTSVPSFIEEGDRLQGLFAHFHRSWVPHRDRLPNSLNLVQFRYINREFTEDYHYHRYDLSEEEENRIWRSAMEQCRQHPMWGLNGYSIEYYFDSDEYWLQDAIEEFRMQERIRYYGEATARRISGSYQRRHI